MINNNAWFFKPLETIKNTISYYTPKVAKDNLAIFLSVLGDPTMSVPLVTYTLNTTVDSLFFTDKDSAGTVQDEDVFYWYIFGALLLLLYPGQVLIAYKKNEPAVNEFFDNDAKEREEKCSNVKSATRSVAIGVVSISGGAAGYLLVHSSRYSSKELSAGYGIFVMALNVLFRQLFFNNPEEKYIEQKYTEGSTKKASMSYLCNGLSLLYSLTSATPFAGAYIFKSNSSIEQAVLTLMLVNMTAGEYIRMNPSLRNRMGVLGDNKIKLNGIEEFICISSAVIRTVLTMASVSGYATPAKIGIYASLTPGVGLFQLSACRPPKEFALDAERFIKNAEAESENDITEIVI